MRNFEITANSTWSSDRSRLGPVGCTGGSRDGVNLINSCSGCSSHRRLSCSPSAVVDRRIVKTAFAVFPRLYEAGSKGWITDPQPSMTFLLSLRIPIVANHRFSQKAMNAEYAIQYSRRLLSIYKEKPLRRYWWSIERIGMTYRTQYEDPRLEILRYMKFSQRIDNWSRPRRIDVGDITHAHPGETTLTNASRRTRERRRTC